MSQNPHLLWRNILIQLGIVSCTVRDRRLPNAPLPVDPLSINLECLDTNNVMMIEYSARRAESVFVRSRVGSDFPPVAARFIPFWDFSVLLIFLVLQPSSLLLFYRRFTRMCDIYCTDPSPARILHWHQLSASV